MRRDDQRRVLSRQRLSIGAERAIEGEKFLITAEGARIDAVALGIGLTTNDGGLTLGIRDQFNRLAIRSGADFLGALFSSRALIGRFALALGLHALEGGAAVLLGQVSAADADRKSTRLN